MPGIWHRLYIGELKMHEFSSMSPKVCLLDQKDFDMGEYHNSYKLFKTQHKSLWNFSFYYEQGYLS